MSQMRRTTFLSAFFFLSATAAHAAVGDQIKAPCVDDKDAKAGSYLRKCSEVLDGAQGAITMVDTQIKKQVDDPSHSIYTGEITETGPTGHPANRPFGKPVCLPVSNPFNHGVAENETNHRGESCGKPAFFQVNVSSGGVKALMHMYGDMGTMEVSYLRGTWVQALTCHWQSVHNELHSSHAVRNNSPGCQAMADTYVQLLGQNQAKSQGIVGLANQADLADIWKCKTDGNLQAAQELCSARNSLEALFQQVAMCEINQRAGKAYRALVPDPTQYINELKDAAAQTCNRQCTDQCSSCTSPLSSAASNCSICGTKCANQCYMTVYRQNLANKLSALPNSGGCSL